MKQISLPPNRYCHGLSHCNRRQAARRLLNGESWKSIFEAEKQSSDHNFPLNTKWQLNPWYPFVHNSWDLWLPKKWYYNVLQVWVSPHFWTKPRWQKIGHFQEQNPTQVRGLYLRHAWSYNPVCYLGFDPFSNALCTYNLWMLRSFWNLDACIVGYFHFMNVFCWDQNMFRPWNNIPSLLAGNSSDWMSLGYL